MIEVRIAAVARGDGFGSGGDCRGGGEHAPEPLERVIVQMTPKPCSTDTSPVELRRCPIAVVHRGRKTSDCSLPQVPVANNVATDVVVSAR